MNLSICYRKTKSNRNFKKRKVLCS